MAIKKFNDFFDDKSLKPIKEAAFQIGTNYKVKLTFDVPKTLIEEYINGVKEKTGKDPLDNFSAPEIAEQIIQYIVSNNLNIDNLPPDFTVGDDYKSVEQEITEEDADSIENDLAGKDEIEFDLEESDSEQDEIKIEEPKTVGEYKKASEEEEMVADSEMDLDELFKKVGYTKKF